VFERLQQLALGDPNASVVDRFFSGASASPKAVFVRLYKNARHHARRAKAQEGASRWWAARLEDLIDELSASFGLADRAVHPERNALPAFLDQEQQGLFVLAYHHMRRWLWMTREERSAWEAEHADAPRAYLWGHKERATADSDVS
jgi:CRISPR-associated protein Csd1